MAGRYPSPELRIAIAQVHARTGRFDDNLRAHLAAVGEARRAGADLLVFGELSLTGYSIRDPELTRWPREESLGALAAEAGELTVVAGAPGGSAAGAFNSAVVLRDGRVVHRQDKVNLPGYPPFDEPDRFRPGAELAAFKLRGWRCAILICEDVWHLPMVNRAGAVGSELQIHVAASATAEDGVLAGNRRGWSLVNAALSLMTGRFVVFANLVGDDAGMRFWGGSAAYAPDGTELGSLGEKEGVLVVGLKRGALGAPGTIRRTPPAAQAGRRGRHPDGDPPPPRPPGPRA